MLGGGIPGGGKAEPEPTAVWSFQCVCLWQSRLKSLNDPVLEELSMAQE